MTEQGTKRRFATLLVTGLAVVAVAGVAIAGTAVARSRQSSDVNAGGGPGTPSPAGLSTPTPVIHATPAPTPARTSKPTVQAKPGGAVADCKTWLKEAAAARGDAAPGPTAKVVAQLRRAGVLSVT